MKNAEIQSSPQKYNFLEINKLIKQLNTVYTTFTETVHVGIVPNCRFACFGYCL